MLLGACPAYAAAFQPRSAVVWLAGRRSLRAHAALYADCGQECMAAINAYYKKDIELLHGPDVT